MQIKRKTAAALVAGLLAGGGAGAVLGLSQVSHAADSGSTTTAPAASTATPTPPASGAGAKATSNEDATHEGTESAEQEAAEDNGTARMGRGHHGGHSNEDPTHEASESPEREKAEDAEAAASSGAASDAPTTAASSANA